MSRDKTYDKVITKIKSCIYDLSGEEAQLCTLHAAFDVSRDIMTFCNKVPPTKEEMEGFMIGALEAYIRGGNLVYKHK